MNLPSTGSRRRLAQAYARVGLETQVMSADPKQLITLLFQGALTAVAQARLHLRSGDIAGRGMAISKAIDIVDSGLKAGIDTSVGGELSENLVTTYDLIVRNLLLANLNADADRLELAHKMLENIAQAWTQAVAEVGSPTHEDA